jgi:16S rRNA (cytidine1402-2'-O)-methyltransferase
VKRQQSFQNERASLYLVPTPIGNLSEMTPRAVAVLKEADVIACEDTRTSGQLLAHFDIHKKLIACQNFNEESSANGIVKLLAEGNTVALISDAGYPLINDPGQKVVRACVDAGFNVIPVSGCSAFLDALVASGLVAMPFVYVGFLPSGQTERRKKLEMYRDYPMTLVFYEAPHRIARMLSDVKDIMGDRPCVLARELTKFHEEFLRGTVSEILEVCDGLKGEMVVVLAGKEDTPAVDLDMHAILTMVNDAMQAGMSTSDAIKETARKTGVSKNRIYQAVHQKN